jgi:hypothetical protein
LFSPFKIDKTNICQSHELHYSTNACQSLTRVNQTNSLQSNDEIKIHICHPDSSITEENLEIPFQSDLNESQMIEITDFETKTVVQNVVDTVVKQTAGIGANPVESLYTNLNDPDSDDLSSHLPHQIAQQSPSVELSSSLQFVRDVHPHQKTQHNWDDSDKCIEKHLLPYVMQTKEKVSCLE